MSDSPEKAALHKKTYEVAYALFRVAATTGERDIAETLKGKAVEVLEGVIAEDYEKTEKSFAVLDYFVKLAMDLGTIGFANGETLIREMVGLKLMIAERVHAQNEAVDISELFAKKPSEKWASGPRIADMSQNISSHDFFSKEGVAVARAEEYPIGTDLKDGNSFEIGSERDASPVTVGVSRSEREQSGNNAAGVFLKSGMRQIAILDKIRQSGNCRMRDIQGILPDSSERTIRYDLEDLIERKLIERTGNGGPSVSYRMR